MPTNDYCFKRLFGHIGNERMTKDLLETILGKKIKKIDLDENPILEKDLKDDKVGVLDIKTTINENEICNIELQVVDQKNIEKRILYYWSKLYSTSIKKGEKYKKLKKTIAIVIANFELDKLKNIPEYHTKWQIREEKYQKIILTNLLELHILELPKTVYAVKEKSDINLLYWLKFIMNPEEIEEMEYMKKVREETKEALEEAMAEWDNINASEYDRMIAGLRVKHILDTNSIYDDGVEDGIEKGIEQGIAQGEKSKALKIAKKLLEKGADIDEIVDITGLDKGDINALKD